MLETSLRVDLLVDRSVIVECEAIGRWQDLYQAQTLTYLRVLSLHLGIVVDFGHELVRDGIQRIVNNRATPSP